jgi:hypothetical protein
VPDTPDKKPQITGITGGAPGPQVDRSGWLPGDPWDAPGAGRGVDPAGEERDGLGRFVKGRSGNPAGRPPGTKTGSFRAGTRAAARLLDAQAEALAQKAIEMALAGDAVAVRFCLGRILGARRGQPVELDLPAVAEPGDLAGVVGAIAAAVAQGGITPDEALALAQMLHPFPRALTAGKGEAADWETETEDAREELARWLDRLAAERETEDTPAR